MTKRALAQELAVVGGFQNPRVDLEQYRTPPDLAAHLIHTADLQGDIEGHRIIDLGCGTGMLALGAALRGPETVVGIDIDPAPLRTAQTNRRRVGSTTTIGWIRADATRAPLVPGTDTTVVMNPPFGAQDGNVHADRGFLVTAAEIGDVCYSIHNKGSRQFVEAFVEEAGGAVTHGFEADFDLPNQYEHHEEDRTQLQVEVFRITWR